MIKRRVMAMSAAGMLSLICAYEGFSPVAYMPTSADVLTIGFGHTSGVKEGDRVTVAEGLSLLQRDLSVYEEAVNRCVTVEMTQGQFDAFTSLAYNIGTGAFCRSTVVKRMNNGDDTGACDAITMWVKQGGKTLRGLVRRREEESRWCSTAYK